jgi:uncharacterized membrane protein YeaQ/YmgE (transglycosylase-associated protein family)
MKITVSQVIVWLVAGGLSGTVVGMLVTRSKTGFGPWANIGIGLMGALIGSALFSLFRIDLGLYDLTISVQDLLAAFVGSFVFLGAVWIARRRFGGSSIGTEE